MEFPLISMTWRVSCSILKSNMKSMWHLMKNYIEEWFKKDINKLTHEGKEAVEMVPVTIDENDKRTSTRK
jgi:hypothetical protein